jgi:uncharacterized protein
LRGRIDALDASAPVRIFVMGIDQWRDEQDWPLPDTTYLDYYLDGAGRANTADGDGVLTTELPAAEATDSYAYDPVATNRVLHGPKHPSRLVLPIIRR